MATLAFIVADGVIYASWLFIVAVGMTLVYGVMRILNVAHGSLYALGAYTAATMVGVWFQRGYAPLGSFALLLVAALLVGVVMGLILELGLLQFLHGRDEVVVVLATYATFLILEDVIQLIWGVEARPAPQPYSLLGTTSVGPLLLNNYDLALIALALLVGGGHRAEPGRRRPSAAPGRGLRDLPHHDAGADRPAVRPARTRAPPQGLTMPARDPTGAALAGAFVVFVAAGFFLPSWAVSLVILSLARGLVALGLVVQFRAGLVSVGQALFFAIGGYAVGLAGLKLRLTDMIVLTVIGVAAATLLGAGLGFLMRRYREIFFAMLSLGFSMLFYGLLVKTETLGSTDGFNVPPPTIFGARLSALATRTLLYDLTVAAAAGAALGIHWRS